MNNEMNKTIDEENQLLLNSQGLAWSKICFDVSVASLLSRFKGTDALTTTKTILYDVSGLVLPGEILFILGPSGSGKSSTLDSLAMRVKAQVGGRVGLHGTLRQDAVWRAKVKYVEQEDNLFEVLSAKETLMYAAEFHVEKKTERQQRVLETIMRLGLENASDTKVGGTFYRGLSGGQRRRVSIGSEMVAMPDVLMLDEPTSGLDSASALKVMQHLREIANSGVVVVATMHQPSRQIWELADKLLLLSGGKTMYCGKRENAMQYFTRHGSVLPPLTSEPDFLLEEINSDFHEDKAKDERLAVGWEQSEERKKLEADIDTWFSSSSAMEQDTNEKTNLKGWGRNGKESVEYKRTILEQISVLASRNLKDALRNPAVIYLRFAMYVALAILIGIAWLRVPAEANRIQDLLGALFFANAFFIFMSIAVLPVYLNGMLCNPGAARTVLPS